MNKLTGGIASSQPTKAGAPGKMVMVNTDFKYDSTITIINDNGFSSCICDFKGPARVRTFKEAKGLLIHEISHTVGVGHTDEESLNATQVPGTPTLPRNGNLISVFNGGSVYPGIQGYTSSLSSGDKKLLQVLYGGKKTRCETNRTL